MRCLNASGNAVSVICHSRLWDSHVSIRKERKTLQQAFVSKYSSGLNSNVGLTHRLNCDCRYLLTLYPCDSCNTISNYEP